MALVFITVSLNLRPATLISAPAQADTDLHMDAHPLLDASCHDKFACMLTVTVAAVQCLQMVNFAKCLHVLCT